MKILDYGNCFNDLVSRMRAKGHNAFYVDILNRYTANAFQYADRRFMTFYDGQHLPYRDGTFDIVVSNQVMEHCSNPAAYYQEASRVLKDTGYMFLHFPHIWIPYDTHSQTWFRHWFGIVSKDRPEYFNWHTKYYHKHIASKYFKTWIDLAPWWRQVKAILFKCDPYDYFFKKGSV